MIVTFEYDMALEESMAFETVYPAALQLELSEKTEIRDSPGSIFVWMFANGQLAGEAYGVPLESYDEEIEGLTSLSAAERRSSIYCYSNTILPPFQSRGLGTILKAHWLGCAAALGFNAVYGHARPGKSQALNAKFGAQFIGDFADWYGTAEEYKLYRLALR